MTNLRGRYTPPTPTTAFAVGQRAVLILLDEVTGRSRYERDYRVVEEAFTAANGTRWVKVAAEPDWHTWTVGVSGAQCPGTQLWPAELVWTE